jgi:dihydrolipoamide dehydrogenase
MMDRVLPMEDEEVSRELEKNFKKIGIAIHTNTMVERIETLKTKVKVHIKRDTKKELIKGSVALLAVGIRGNTEDMGLEKIGIKIEKGAVLIDDYGRTNVQNIFAIGDVTGPPWLAHVASAQGHVAAEIIAGHPTFPVDYSNIPACTYCQPQVASLGLTEAQARDTGHDVKVGRFNFNSSGKAMAIGSTHGFVKIVFDAKHGELLGCHIIGVEATELIAELAMAKGLEATWQDLARTIHAHPTLSEAIMEAALDAFGEAIHQ